MCALAAMRSSLWLAQTQIGYSPPGSEHKQCSTCDAHALTAVAMPPREHKHPHELLGPHLQQRAAALAVNKMSTLYRHKLLPPRLSMAIEEEDSFGTLHGKMSSFRPKSNNVSYRAFSRKACLLHMCMNERLLHTSMNVWALKSINCAGT